MADSAPRAPWLTRGVGGIGAASLLSDLGHEVPTSLLPRLIASLGGSAAVLGIIEGISDALSGIARLAGGALADDPARRRTTAVGGYASTAVLSGLIGASTSVWQVGLLRAGAWTTRGLRVPSRNALLADATAPEAYGRAYGFERMMDNLGAIGGPLLAIALVAAFSVRTAILLSIVPGLLATLAVIDAVAHLQRPARRERQPLRFRFRPVLRAGGSRLFAAIGAFEIGNVATTLLILRATELLTPTRGLASAATVALLLYVGYNVAATAASLAAGHANDRVGSRPVLLAGVLLSAGAYAMFGVAGGSVWVLLTAFAVAGVGSGCVQTAENAAVAGSVPATIRGSAFGMLAAIQSFGNLAASGLAGVIWTVLSPGIAFAYLAAWMLVSVALLTRVRRPEVLEPI